MTGPDRLGAAGRRGRRSVLARRRVPAYRALGVDADLLPGAAHLDPDAGYGRWPAVEAWCRAPATRLVVR